MVMISGAGIIAGWMCSSVLLGPVDQLAQHTFVLYKSFPRSSSSALACLSSASFWRSRFCSNHNVSSVHSRCAPLQLVLGTPPSRLACSSRSRVDRIVDIC